MEREIRIPQQKRSIDKKNRIIEAAQRVFNQNGYFGTNTAEIAKEAGLSVGSVYAYFEDKKDILLACLNIFGDKLTDDICREIGRLKDGDLEDATVRAIKILVDSHEGQSQLYHDEIEALQCRDEDVRRHFIEVQDKLMAAITDAVGAHGYVYQHSREQTFLLFQMVRGIQDELTFNSGRGIDHDILIRDCAKLIVSMVERKEG